ncbi:BTB domain-containing protein [Mycena sanguinolenta]|uniref:BTB domain-containing protein n=1 Tax=Mycena sanguinolenta TaxID=230812 RepID=A0A8H6ZFF8_9AGAR|nr:BTB domain-containing protein [Mycena sanguinolenta]
MADSGVVESTSGMDRRDPDLYIEDGNIVLSAKDSEKNTIYFRIHKSTLVKNSPEAFGNMFAIPAPPTMDQYDGVPLVQMPDDAEALHDFLALLYDPQCIVAILEAEDFPKLLGPTELAKKYQVDWICKLVASQLAKSWPTSTLLSWNTIAEDEQESRIRNHIDSWEPAYNDQSHRLRRLPEPVSSIILAHHCDVPAILPAAFLHLLRFPFESQIDEDEVDPSGFLSSSPFYPWQPPMRALLSQKDWERLALARERIEKWFSKAGTKPWNDCGSGMRCEAVISGTWLKIVRSGIGMDGNALNVEALTKRLQYDNICAVCKQELSTKSIPSSIPFSITCPTFFN